MRFLLFLIRVLDLQQFLSSFLQKLMLPGMSPLELTSLAQTASHVIQIAWPAQVHRLHALHVFKLDHCPCFLRKMFALKTVIQATSQWIASVRSALQIALPASLTKKLVIAAHPVTFMEGSVFPNVPLGMFNQITSALVVILTVLSAHLQTHPDASLVKLTISYSTILVTKAVLMGILLMQLIYLASTYMSTIMVQLKINISSLLFISLTLSQLQLLQSLALAVILRTKEAISYLISLSFGVSFSLFLLEPKQASH